MRQKMSIMVALLGLMGFGLTSSAFAISIQQGSGANAAAIQAPVDAFRGDLGALNANVVGSLPSGRREINWDGVSDTFAAPNNLPADFFNINSPRGVLFSTSGTGFQVSANAINPTNTPVRFGNLDPAFPDAFTVFSPQRLFTALNSNIVDVNFVVPGSNSQAAVNGFGSVFTDVDLPNTTSIQFFNANNMSLGTFFRTSRRPWPVFPWGIWIWRGSNPCSTHEWECPVGRYCSDGRFYLRRAKSESRASCA